MTNRVVSFSYGIPGMHPYSLLGVGVLAIWLKPSPRPYRGEGVGGDITHVFQADAIFVRGSHRNAFPMRRCR